MVTITAYVGDQVVDLEFDEGYTSLEIESSYNEDSSIIRDTTSTLDNKKFTSNWEILKKINPKSITHVVVSNDKISLEKESVDTIRYHYVFDNDADVSSKSERYITISSSNR